VLCEVLGRQRKEVRVGRRDYHNKEFHDFISGQNLLGLSNQENYMGGSCCEHGGELHTSVCYGCKSEVERPIRYRWENNTEKDLIEIACDFVQE
jgi:hypothetical protein